MRRHEMELCHCEKSNLCPWCTTYWLLRSQKSVLSGHRDCFLGKEICISFLVYSTVMLWVDFTALAAEKMIMIMRQRYVEIEGKPFVEYIWRPALCQARGEHNMRLDFRGLKSK